MILNESLEQKVFSLTRENLNATAENLTPEEINSILNFLWDYCYVDGSDKAPLEQLKLYITFRFSYSIENYITDKTDELYKIYKEII